MLNGRHSWLFPESPSQAIAVQREMVKSVFLEDRWTAPISCIAGMDVSNTPFDPAKMIYSAAVTLSFPSLTLSAVATHADKQRFPYISGLLAFREAPALVEAFKQLPVVPDLMMVDGHGVSHPRGLGIASHIGVLLEIPTIGVGKSILVGKPEGILGEAAGSTVPLVWKGMTVGMVVRTKKGCNPLYVSAGHRTTLSTAVKLVMCSVKGYRLPEPIRQAHLAANACRRTAKTHPHDILSKCT